MNLRNINFGMALALCAAAAWALPQSAAAQTYHVYDLGTLAGGSLSVGYGVNDFGVGVGASQTATQSNEAFYSTSAGIFGIGDLGGGDSTARAINDFNKIVGGSLTAGGDNHAFVWTKSTGFLDLGTLAGKPGFNSIAYGVNDFGKDASGHYSSSYETVVGDSDTLSGSTEAFAWNKLGGLVDLGNLGGGESHARAINEFNQIAGYSVTSSGDTHAFIYVKGKGFTDLGTLANTSGSQSLANAINDWGTVVGTSTVVSGDFHAFSTSNGGLIDLGTLAGVPGFNSFALGVSDECQIVGSSDTLAGDTHAFLWDSQNGMRDLNSLIPATSGWTLNQASAISKDGYIVGFGLIKGQTHAFILVNQSE